MGLLLEPTEEQLSITGGDFFENMLAPAAWGFRVFGRVLTDEELRATEGEPVMRALALAYRNGYRYTQCHSAREEDGSPGSVHVSALRKITAEEFEAARAAGWR